MLNMPPPSLAVLPLTVVFLRVSVPYEFRIPAPGPPPLPPLLPLTVLFINVAVAVLPSIKMPQPVLLLPVLLGSVMLALIASTAPLRLLQQIQLAGILRGE